MSVALMGGSLTLGASSYTARATQTATPSIAALSCTVVIATGDVYVSVNVTNNDASSATVEAAENSAFIGAQSATVAGGGVQGFQFFGFSNPAGTQTFYARATATGKVTSITFSRTDNMTLCNAE